MGLIVRDHEELARRLRGLRDAGKRVVFTNGCFDLLHVGHIRCLQDAANRGDYLVVALNSDASVRKLKGPSRPVQNQDERAELLCALNGVAYVTIFDDETCGPLLKLLRPQLVAKGCQSKRCTNGFARSLISTASEVSSRLPAGRRRRTGAGNRMVL